MKLIASILLCAPVLACTSAVAGPSTNELGVCLADNTTGKDRKDLARWIFLAMTAHPDIKSFTNASAAVRIETDKTMAALVTRLLTVNCAEQAKNVVGKDGGNGMVAAFQSLGGLATLELMSDPAVSTSIAAYTQYLDQKKLQSVLSTSP